MENIKKVRIMSLFIVLVLLGSFSAGCSQPADEAKSNSESVGKSTQTSSKEAVDENSGKKDESTANQAKVVTDMAGREVTIEGDVESIGTFGSVGVLNAFVQLMGDGDKIINEMPPSFSKGDKWKYQYVFSPQLSDGPVFEDESREVQIETVLETAPDLCLTMSKDIVSTLEEKGLTVLYLEWGDLSDIETAVKLLGEVLNKQDVAEDYLSYFDAKIKEAEELVKDISEEDRKSVLYGSVTTYTQPHIIAEWWISAAGGLSVTDNGRDTNSYEYTVEDLLAWNPDVMIVTDKDMGNEITADERFKDITAVKEGAIYPIPTVAHVWGNRTVEQPLTVMWTINKLYPDIMTEEMLKEEISYYYNHFFKTDLTDEQMNEIINQA